MTNTPRESLEHAVRLREATLGMPQDGPYPATVDEVADEVIKWIREMDGTCARGLSARVADRLVPGSLPEIERLQRQVDDLEYEALVERRQAQGPGLFTR